MSRVCSEVRLQVEFQMKSRLFLPDFWPDFSLIGLE